MQLVVITLAFVLIIVYLAYETYIIKVSFHNISKNKNFSIVQLSDIHGRIRYLNGSISDKVNELNPDCVIITGDLATKKGQLKLVNQELARIQCDNVIFILGNYERQTVMNFSKREYSLEEHNEIVTSLQSLGITVLINGYIRTEIQGSQLLIYGFDNSIYGNENLKSNVDWNNNDYVILFAHCPSILKFIEHHNLNYNLLLTGHTHGGQIRLFNKTVGSYKYYHTGMRKLDSQRNFYINRGLGTVKLPFRLSCPPEIAVFQF